MRIKYCTCRVEHKTTTLFVLRNNKSNFHLTVSALGKTRQFRFTWIRANRAQASVLKLTFAVINANKNEFNESVGM